MQPIPRYQRRAEIRELTLKLLAAHGLHDWSFEFNARKRSLGLCRYALKRIELSIYLIELNGDAEIRDTILHEIAHALVGPKHGHDYVWQRKALEVGASPQRCSHGADMPQGRWQAQCPTCGKTSYRHRKPRQLEGWYCRACGPERGALVWKHQ